MRRVSRPCPPTARAATGWVLAGAALVASCSGDAAPAVRLAAVTVSRVTEVVEAPATVTAKATATVSAPGEGAVETLAVRDGQHVAAGQILVRLDSPSARAQLVQARAADADAASAGRVSTPGVDLSAQQAQVDAAASAGFAAARDAAARIADAAVRTEALAAVARAEAQYTAARDQAQATVRQFNAGVTSLAEALGSLASAQRVQTRAAVAVAERAVAALTVRAPIAGTVSFGAPPGGAAAGDDLSGLLGQLPPEAQGQAAGALGGAAAGGAATQTTLAAGVPVRAGQALLTITDVSALSLSAEVDETDVLLVRPGVRADVEFDAVPGASYTATVRSVDLAPATSSRGGVSYRVRLALGGGTTADGDAAPPPRPGMSAVADLIVRSVRGAVTVPSSAVVRDGQRDTVFVADGGRARRRPVELGAQGDATVQVLTGVRPGERVVVAGADRLRDGQELPG